MFFLRVVAGIVLVYAGWWKLHNEAANIAGFASMHMSPWIATGITWLELIGGVALILGIFTCFFAMIFAIEMAVATVLTWKMGFQMVELPLLMTAIMIALKHGGRGMWGLGRRCGCFICRNKESKV
jgi:uncharacterized membrane protein YphA (DoxX/SURF4 family)